MQKSLRTTAAQWQQFSSKTCFAGKLSFFIFFNICYRSASISLKLINLKISKKHSTMHVSSLFSNTTNLTQIASNIDAFPRISTLPSQCASTKNQSYSFNVASCEQENHNVDNISESRFLLTGTSRQLQKIWWTMKQSSDGFLFKTPATNSVIKIFRLICHHTCGDLGFFRWDISVICPVIGS